MDAVGVYEYKKLLLALAASVEGAKKQWKEVGRGGGDGKGELAIRFTKWGCLRQIGE